MAHFSFWGWNEPLANIDNGLQRLWSSGARRDELIELAGVLREQIRRVTVPALPGEDLPLHVHARYSLAELLAAFGVPNPAASRGSGVKWVEAERADVFWFNLRKTEKHFSPTTMYADRAISPSLFQWESQNATSEASKTGQRYIHQRARGTSVHLFFRDSKEADGDLGAPRVSVRRPRVLRQPHRRPTDAHHLEARSRVARRCLPLSSCRGGLTRPIVPMPPTAPNVPRESSVGRYDLPETMTGASPGMLPGKTEWLASNPTDRPFADTRGETLREHRDRPC